MHFISVFDTPTKSNLPGKVYLELKEDATPYQAPVCRVPQAVYKPLKSEIDKPVDQSVLHITRWMLWLGVCTSLC